MEILILMAQRKCSYPGEYAPETLGCMAEAELIDNPEYLENERRKHIDSGEFEAVEILTLKVDDDAVSSRLFPAHDPIDAEVLE
ncbi:hypothetical protein [Thioalkalivibrio thiocyanodenitrificans]|uniref:hypothetical protein n=1 Tax=Thioalkalivibrio thiocyanodenitrificans TaxID=243063 RepID=UPI00036E7463|nr:hypothetical protein [Thioalkalivibrio thiocyanodenitrificans]